MEAARAQLVGLGFPGDEVVTGHIPFTPRAKKSLELALRESLALAHEYIGTEHILLGLLRQSDSVASRVLNSFEPNSEKVREAVMQMLGDPGQPPPVRLRPGRVLRSFETPRSRPPPTLIQSCVGC